MVLLACLGAWPYINVLQQFSIFVIPLGIEVLVVVRSEERQTKKLIDHHSTFTSAIQRRNV
jgi:hypothetical protein